MSISQRLPEAACRLSLLVVSIGVSLLVLRAASLPGLDVFLFTSVLAVLAAPAPDRQEAGAERPPAVDDEQEATPETTEAPLEAGLLTNVSHAFRTPLAIILGYAELLEEISTGEARTYVDEIKTHGRRLSALLNAAIDLTALENLGDVIERYDVDVRREIGQTLQTYGPLLREKRLYAHVEPIEGPLFARTDRYCLLRILDALVDNAVKYTDAGGLTVRAFVRAEWVYIEVEDTGIGMDAAFLPEAFDAFRQEDAGVDRAHGGIGVGLTVAGRLARHLGGTLRAASRKGAGSTFTLVLPAAPAPSGPWPA